MSDSKTPPMPSSAISFPCAFPIKIMGLATEEFEGIVVPIIRQHVPNLGEGAITLKYSRDNKYVSLTVTIQATSQEQLDNLYRSLTSQTEVLLVL